MIIKGNSVAGAKRLAVHLARVDTNERAELKEVRGVVAEDLREALLEMETVAAGTRTTKPFYHGSINPAEPLTAEQWVHAIDRMEADLGLTGQPRVVVAHVKEGREHRHIVWSRIDLERMAAISDSHNYRKHEQIARDLEREFGHDRVQGAHVERDGKERPERTPSHAEMLQADRTGLSPKEVKKQITEIWRSTESGQEFAVALWEHGYVLARGDRRDFVVIDPRGGTHSLARRIDGANAKDVRERMADLDPKRLPNIADAKTIQLRRQARDAARTKEAGQEPVRDSVKVDSAKVDVARDQGRNENTRAADTAGLAAAGAAKTIADVAGGIASVFESLIGGEEHKPQTPEERAAFARGQQEAAAEREEAEAAKADKAQRLNTDEQQARRHKLMLEFGREIQRDADEEREQDNERERGRSR